MPSDEPKKCYVCETQYPVICDTIEASKRGFSVDDPQWWEFGLCNQCCSEKAKDARR